MNPSRFARLLTLALALAVTRWLAPVLRAQSADLSAGSLDPAFNVPAAALPPGGFIPYRLFPTPDGGVLVGGTVNLLLGPSAEPDVLVRLRADGSRDDTFHARLPRPDGLYLQPVAVDTAGRALVFQRGGPEFDFTFGVPIVRFLRLLPDGSVDPTFEGPSRENAPIPPTGPYDGPDIYQVLPLPDGSLLVAGRFTSLGGQRTKFAARLRADGSVDPAVRFRPPVSKGGFANAFIQPDGKVVITDTSNRSLRYNTDGSPDDTFQFTHPANVFPFLLQPDGKFLALVRTGIPNRFGFSQSNLIRVNADGTLDNGFNATTEPDLVPPTLSYGPTVFQPDGRILVTPEPLEFEGERRLLRLHPDGRVDVSFNAAVSFHLGSGVEEAKFTALALTPGGDFLFAAGVTITPSPDIANGIPAATIVRLRLADPLPLRANLVVCSVNPALTLRDPAVIAGANAFRLRAGLRLLNTGDKSVRNVPFAAYLTDRTDYGTAPRPFRESADPSLVKLELLPTLDASGNLLSLKLRLPGAVGDGPPVGFPAVRKLAAGRAAPLAALKLNIAPADLAAFRGKTLLIVLDPAGTVAETDATDNAAVLPLVGLP